MTADARDHRDDWEAAARRLWPVRRWLARHERVVDIAVVASCGAIQLLGVIYLGDAGDAVAYAFAALAALTLLGRRRYPLGTLVVVVGIGAAADAVSSALDYPNLPFVFALYAVASIRGAGPAVLGYLIGIALPMVTVVTRAVVVGQSSSPMVLEPLALLAVTVGIVVRSQRQRRDALAEVLRERSERARVTERARIAAEMHDVVAHSLSVMIALANGASSAWEKHPERSAEALRRLAEVGRTSLTDMSRILQLLSDADATERNEVMGAAREERSLIALIEVFRQAGLPVTMTREGAPRHDDPALRMTVYRIVQESLTNALRYAHGATRVDVFVADHTDAVEVVVSDDAPPTSRTSHGARLGLLGIAARTSAYNGTSESGPLIGGGWRTRATLRPDDRGAPDA